MDKIHGKPIDVTKLKPQVLKDVAKKLKIVKDISKELKKRYSQVQQKKCYICAGVKATPFANIHGFQYVRCDMCGHLYTTVRYSTENLLEFYRDNEHYSTGTYADPASYRYRIDNVARPKVEFLEKYAPKKGKLIDAGSGIGDIPLVAKQNGWDAVGVEISTHSVKFGKEKMGAPLVQDAFEHYLANVPDKSIDAISLIGFLEHTTDPLAFLKDVYRVLKKGGVIMAQVPSADSLSCEIQAVFPENVFRHMVPMDHYQLFSQKSLVQAVRKSSFKPLAIWFHGLDVYELLNNISIEKPNVVGSPFYASMLASMNDLQQTMDNAEKSDRMIIIARKQ